MRPILNLSITTSGMSLGHNLSRLRGQVAHSLRLAQEYFPVLLLILTSSAFTTLAAAQVKSPAGKQEVLQQIQADILAQRWDQAQAKLNAAASMLDGSPDFHFMQAAVLVHNRNLERALQELGRAVALNPKQAQYYLLRGQVYSQAGDSAAAERDFQKALAEAVNPEIVLSVVEKIFVPERRYTDALAALEQALRRMPGSPALHYELGRIQEYVGQAAEAMANYARAVELNPRLAAAQGNLGRLYRSRPETLALSAKHLEQARELDPQNPRWPYELGMTYLEQQNLEGAQARLEEAARLDPNEARIYSALAQVYRQRGMAEQARQSLKRFGELASQAEKEKTQLARLEADFMRAQDLELAGNRQEAAALYLQILSVSPNEAQVLFALARLHLSAGEPARAEEYVRQALAQNSDNADYHQLYAKVLIQLGRRQEAAETLRRAISLKPSDSVSHNLLGNLLLESGEIAQAIAAYQRAVELTPDDPDYRLDLARAYRRKGDATAAQRELEVYQRLVSKQTPR